MGVLSGSQLLNTAPPPLPPSNTGYFEAIVGRAEEATTSPATLTLSVTEEELEKSTELSMPATTTVWAVAVMVARLTPPLSLSTAR